MKPTRWSGCCGASLKRADVVCYVPQPHGSSMIAATKLGCSQASLGGEHEPVGPGTMRKASCCWYPDGPRRWGAGRCGVRCVFLHAQTKECFGAERLRVALRQPQRSVCPSMPSCIGEDDPNPGAGFQIRDSKRRMTPKARVQLPTHRAVLQIEPSRPNQVLQLRPQLVGEHELVPEQGIE